jgi:CheY-like chemotaxis protein
MPYKILIVDDSKLARMSVAKVLKTLEPDWLKVDAANADEALTLFASERPDIALLDFNMPGRDGLALAAELHALDPHMPVAVVSANIQIEIVNRAKSVGADFLAKPLTEPALAEFLARAKRRLSEKSA